MKMKFDKVFQSIEAHVEKVIVGGVGIVCVFLLFVYVFGNPYGVIVDGEKRSPGQIDPYVRQQAQQLTEILNGSTDPMPYDKIYVRKYEQLQQGTLPDVAAEIFIPIPGIGDQIIQEDRLYAIPVVPDLTGIQIETMRGAAEVPEEEVSPEMTYDAVATSTADVDLVTVSARMNIDALINGFEQSFMGPRLKSSWKDPLLAKPVFARLELQRRNKMNDGQWGQWEEVPPTRINAYRQLISTLPLTMDKSQYGVDLWKSQFDSPEVEHALLQPKSYTFTVSRTDWMPPKYLQEMLEIMRRDEQERRREELEDRRSQTQTTVTRRNPAPRGGGIRPADVNPIEMRNPGGLVPRTPTRRDRTAEDVQSDFQKELLDETSRLASRPESLLVWAHDDTIEPGQTYQYRIRAGVFNPIAGKDWFEAEQADFKDQVVLWSRYSEPTREISIPRRVYVFPQDVIASTGDSGQPGSVKVEVMKYYLGIWRDSEFNVFPGETIGYEVEDVLEVKNPTGDEMMDVLVQQPAEMIDFSTGYTLIDIRNRVTWGTRLRQDSFSQMLYYDGQQMKDMPIAQRNWTAEMQNDYRMVLDEMNWGVQQSDPGMDMGVPGGLDRRIPGLTPEQIRQRLMN